MAGHDTYTRDSKRVDLSLSHKDPRTVVLTEFGMVDGRWTQTKDAAYCPPRETIEDAQQLMASMANVLLTSGHALTTTRRCDLFVCDDIVVPGTDHCPAHQHAVVCITHDGKVTVECACGETFDSDENHAKHAANA